MIWRVGIHLHAMGFRHPLNEMGESCILFIILLLCYHYYFFWLLFCYYFVIILEILCPWVTALMCYRSGMEVLYQSWSNSCINLSWYYGIDTSGHSSSHLISTHTLGYLDIILFTEHDIVFITAHFKQRGTIRIKLLSQSLYVTSGICEHN